MEEVEDSEDVYLSYSYFEKEIDESIDQHWNVVNNENIPISRKTIEEEEEGEESYNSKEFAGFREWEGLSKDDIFSKQRNLYRLIVAGKGKSDTELVWKMENERGHIFHLLQDLDVGKHCEPDLSSINFKKLNEIFLKINGVIGTKRSVVKFFREKVSEELANNLESYEMKCGIYLLMSDPKEKEGYAFVWEGEQTFFVDDPRRSPLCTLKRFMYEISCDIIFCVPRDIIEGFKPKNTFGYKPEMVKMNLKNTQGTKKEDKFEVIQEDKISCNPSRKIKGLTFAAGNENLTFFQKEGLAPRIDRRKKIVSAHRHELEEKFKSWNICVDPSLKLDRLMSLGRCFPEKSLLHKISVKAFSEIHRCEGFISDFRNGIEIRSNHSLQGYQYEKRLQNVLEAIIINDPTSFCELKREFEQINKETEKITKILACPICHLRSVQEKLFQCEIGFHSCCEVCLGDLSYINACPRCYCPSLNSKKYYSGREEREVKLVKNEDGKPVTKISAAIRGQIRREEQLYRVFHMKKEKLKKELAIIYKPALEDYWNRVYEKKKKETYLHQHAIFEVYMKHYPYTLNYLYRNMEEAYQDIIRCDPETFMLKKSRKNNPGNRSFPFYVEIQEHVKRKRNQIKEIDKIDIGFFNKYKRRVIQEIVDKYKNKKKRIDDSNFTKTGGEKIKEMRKELKILKEKHTRKIKEQFQVFFNPRKDRSLSLKKIINCPYEYYENTKTQLICEERIKKKASVQYKLSSLYFENIKKTETAVHNDPKHVVKGEIYDYRCIKWEGDNIEKLLYFYEMKDLWRLKVVATFETETFTKRKNHVSLVYLYPPGATNISSHKKYFLERLPFVPYKIDFDEETKLLVVVRKCDFSSIRACGEDIGIFVVDIQKRMLLDSKVIALSNHWENIGEEREILDLCVVPGERKAVVLRRDGKLYCADLYKGKMKIENAKEVEDFEDKHNLKMFCPLKTFVLMIYYSKKKKVWICEARLLNNQTCSRENEDGEIIKEEKSMFDILATEELGDYSKDTKFSMFFRSFMSYIFGYDTQSKKLFSHRVEHQSCKGSSEYTTELSKKERYIPKLNQFLSYFHHSFTKFPTINAIDCVYKKRKVFILLDYEEKEDEKEEEEEEESELDEEEEDNDEEEDEGEDEGEDDEEDDEEEDEEENILVKCENYMKNLFEHMSNRMIGDLGLEMIYGYLSVWKPPKKEKKKNKKKGKKKSKKGKRNKKKKNMNLERYKLGMWLEKLICLIPIQIARHEFGEFKLLTNGFPVNLDDELDTIKKNDKVKMKLNDFVKKLNFGLYDTILKSKDKIPVFVVSCAGTQTTGKSTFLNNFGGTFFNTGSDRCTVGIWMSLKCTSKALYVFLDFEGIGTLLKTRHEDMISSLFGSAISNLFVIRTQVAFDRWTENTLNNWSQGARLIKFKSDRLFNGDLVMNLKDVMASGSRDAVNEYCIQFNKSLKRNQEEIQETREDNNSNDSEKTLNMFVGTSIQPTSHPDTQDYLKEVIKISRSLKKKKSQFSGGIDFLNFVKILLVQLSFNNFQSIDSHYIEGLVQDVKKEMNDVIYGGATSNITEMKKNDGKSLRKWKNEAIGLKSEYNGSTLINDKKDIKIMIFLTTEEEIEVFKRDFIKKNEDNKKIEIGIEEEEDSGYANSSLNNNIKGYIKILDVPDTGLILGPVNGFEKLFRKDEKNFWVALSILRKREFEELIGTVDGGIMNSKIWNELFQSFLSEIVERRNRRTSIWMENRLRKKMKMKNENQEFRLLIEESLKKIRKLRAKWVLCQSQCIKCFKKCSLLYSHHIDHDCGFDHRCIKNCEICMKVGKIHRCKDPSGHGDRCFCAEENHQCGKICFIKEKYPKVTSCLGICSKDPGHAGDCICSSPEHRCGKKCTLRVCGFKCILPYNEDHKRHQCHRNKCPMKCHLCNNECQSNDHFHSIGSPNKEDHLCGEEHQCKEKCQHPGTCGVRMNLLFKKISEFTDDVGNTFAYNRTAEFNHDEKKCQIRIPKNKLEHEGNHLCCDPKFETENSTIHKCVKNCDLCGYFCNLPYKHEGLHDTTHGSMQHGELIVGQGEGPIKVKIDGKNSAIIRSKMDGKVTMCRKSCIDLGRGHIHLIKCEHLDPNECELEKKRKQIQEHVRHQTIIYDPNNTYDEVKCEFYWKDFLKFKSNFTPNEKNEFRKCDCLCPSKFDHGKKKKCNNNNNNNNDNNNNNNLEKEEKVYCELDLWHPPMKKEENFPIDGKKNGYISENGHFFPCCHPERFGGKIHTYLIVDISGSMAHPDIRPSKNCEWARKSNNNRLGAVFEAITNYLEIRKNKCSDDKVSLVTFNVIGKVAFENSKVNGNLIKKNKYCVRKLKPKNGTRVITGLQLAFDLLEKNNENYPSVFVVFTDGADCKYSSDAILNKGFLQRKVNEFEKIVTIHTVGFNSNKNTGKYLRRIAEIGGGNYHSANTKLDIVSSFKKIAHKPKGGVHGIRREN